MKKTLGIFMVILILFISGCNKSNNVRMTEDSIKEQIEKDSTFKVYEVTYATDSVTVSDLKCTVDNDTVKIGDKETQTIGETNKYITGYYDDSGLTYYLYKLVTSSSGKTSIAELVWGKNDSFEDTGWVFMPVEEPTDLILVKGREASNYTTRYKIYAISNGKLTLVR